MSREFCRRYGVEFEPIMMCDDPLRFQKASPVRVVERDRISVVYAGTLASGRWVPILDVCRSVSALQQEGLDVVLTVFASGIPPDAVVSVGRATRLQVLPAPTHAELPSYLKGADILLLPESYEKRQAGSIRLSISTKAHLYMMSERPVLVYGPPITGVVQYAKRHGWAAVVERPDCELLKASLRRLCSDEAYRRELIKRGSEVAAQNHDGRAVREQFRLALCQCTTSRRPSRRLS